MGKQLSSQGSSERARGINVRLKDEESFRFVTDFFVRGVWFFSPLVLVARVAPIQLALRRAGRVWHW